MSDTNVREREVPDARPFYDLPIGSDLTRYGKDYDVAAGESARYTLAHERMFDGRPIYVAQGWIVKRARAGIEMVHDTKWYTRDGADADNRRYLNRLQEDINASVCVLDEKTSEVMNTAVGGRIVDRWMERIVAYSQVEVVKRRLVGRKAT